MFIATYLYKATMIKQAPTALMLMAILSLFHSAVQADDGSSGYSDSGITLTSLTFTSDFNNMTSWTADYTDGNAPVYSKPDWNSSGTNNPIVHKKGIYVQLYLHIQNSTYRPQYGMLEGKSPKGEYLHFGPENIILDPGDNQTIMLEANAPLPNNIAENAGDVINWTFTNDYSSPNMSATTGPHQIYVTADKPYGSEVTEKRVKFVTTECDQLAKEVPCVDKIFNDFGTNFDSRPGPTLNLWNMANGDMNVQCKDIARFMKLCIGMLGWTPQGDVALVFPLPVGEASEVIEGEGSPGYVDRHAGTLVYHAGNGYNLYEGCYKLTAEGETTYWLGGTSMKAHGDVEVIKDVADATYWSRNVTVKPPATKKKDQLQHFLEHIWN